MNDNHRICIMIEITPNIAIEENEIQLEFTHAVLMAAIDASPAGIIIADAPDGRLWSVNSAAQDMRNEPIELLTDIPIEQYSDRWQCFHAGYRCQFD